MKKSPTRTTEQRGDETREALLAAATSAFAASGFHAVSTRHIADSAKANLALIRYHFGGKEGLYLAVFERIAGEIRQRIDPLAARIASALESTHGESRPELLRKQLLPALFDLTDGLVASLMDESSGEWAQLILREQQAPSAAFDLLYDGFMGRVTQQITAVIGKFRSNEDDKANRLLAISIMGQMMILRNAHAGVLRHMGWTSMGAIEIRAAQQCLRANITALLIGAR